MSDMWRKAGVDRERLVDEILMLLPGLGRILSRPGPVELGGASEELKEARVSSGHVQVMIALTKGPHSVGRLAEALGVSRPAATQLVDRLVEHGIVERHHDPEDRRIVMVDYAPGEREIAQRIVASRRRPLELAVEQMTDEELEGFLKGMRLLVESLDASREIGR